MFDSIGSTLHSKLFWVTAFFVLFYLYMKKIVYTYWTRHGIPQEDATVPIGMFDADYLMRKKTLAALLENSYEKFKKYPYHGLYLFHKRALMINDPELIKHILVKDFSNFCDRGMYCNTELDPLTAHLFLLSGEKWKTLRAKLTPTFTSGKLKHMFPTLKIIAENMIQVADENLLTMDYLELKDIFARYTTDTIFNLAFGVESNCLREPNNQFRHYGDMSVETNLIRLTLAMFVPGLLTAFKQPFLKPELTKFFTDVFRDMVNKRKAENIIVQDFLDSLIDLMEHETDMDVSTDGKSKEETKKLTLLEATAQAFVFFIAGFETASSISTYCLYELAINPQMQEKVHEEIDNLLRNSADLTYNDLLSLEYLDMTFHETMRKHSTLPNLNRICVKDYQIPNSNYIIPKGMSIVIPVSGLHNDPNIYPEPEKFDPERFSKENIATRAPYTFLPFGEGPRMCIANRFGMLQTKIAVFHMLKNYRFSVCDKTQIPCEYAIDSIFQTPRYGVYLKAERRKITRTC